MIINEHIYAGVPPLYKITEGNGKSYKYLKDDAALAEYSQTHSSQKYQVNRLKGLGEMGESETEETLVNENTRIIKLITVKDINAANNAFRDLMGDMPIARKKFLKTYAKERMYNVE